MKTFSLQLDDSKFKGLHPQEDSLIVKDNIFVVADGITRDPIGISDFTGKKPEEVLKNYPNPSPAKKAADTFTESFIECIKIQPDIKKAFLKSNQKIKELNQQNNPNPDYLENDYWACVACGGFIQNNKFYWGNIGDCLIKVYDKDFNLKLDSPNSVSNFEKEFYSHKPQDFDWNKPGSRVLIRKEYRNNPNNKASYGALTGEQIAENFMNFGDIQLSTGDFIILYSDGFEGIVNEPDSKNILNKVRQQNSISPLEDYVKTLESTDWVKFGREKSIVITITN